MEKQKILNAQANVNYDNRTNRNYTENADMTPQNDYQYDRKCKRDERISYVRLGVISILGVFGFVLGYKYIDARYSAQPVKA